MMEKESTFQAGLLPDHPLRRATVRGKRCCEWWDLVRNLLNRCKADLGTSITQVKGMHVPAENRRLFEAEEQRLRFVDHGGRRLPLSRSNSGAHRK